MNYLGPMGRARALCCGRWPGYTANFLVNIRASAWFIRAIALGLDELLSPLENLAWFAGLQDQALDRSEALRLLARLGLLEQAHTPCQRLSAGQQRRAAIARWLLAPQSLWLLDEPFNALDAQSQQLLNELLSEHCAGGGAVICATHLILQVAEKPRCSCNPNRVVTYEGAIAARTVGYPAYSGQRYKPFGFLVVEHFAVRYG